MSIANPELEHVTRPPRAPGSAPHPALLLLHGYGADELDLLPLADELDGRFYVVSARAPLALRPGFAWYHLDQNLRANWENFRASLAALARFVATLPGAYPIDPGRIFTLGFSQGAVLAGSLFLTQPDVPAGTVMLSGYLPLEAGLEIHETGLKGRRVFVGHGALDPLIPVAAGREARDYLQAGQADLTYREYPIGHGIGPEELDDVAAWLKG